MNKENFDLSALTEFSNGLKNIFFTVKFFNGNKECFFSNSVQEITGYTSAEINLLPENLHSLICEEEIGNIQRSITKFENDPSADSIELVYRINTKNNNVVWLQEVITAERNNGRISVQKSTVLDITELKEKEDQLTKSCDSLKDLNAAKDKFISIITHDLRAPFTTLLGFSEILVNEPDLSNEEKNEYLRYIYDASKNQLNLINCLLDWSRLQTGKIKVEPVRLNVKNVVSTAITPFTGDAFRKNIDVKTDIPSDLYILADERLIGQAVINLTSNAIKFTPEGKDVHISSSRFKEGMIEIVVRDEGLGISEENQSKLFRIDQKFTLTGTSGEKGSGLGLTLVKEIIDRHGGQVWFYSQIGEGSEFHFTVPEAKNTVLVVEDDKATRLLFQKIIETNLTNFEVKFAENGYEAIAYYRELHPTIVITDHDMPLMNGIQLIEAIQKKEANRNIPIIVISAKLNVEITKKYQKLGVERIIAKPIQQEELVQMIRDCLY